VVTASMNANYADFYLVQGCRNRVGNVQILIRKLVVVAVMQNENCLLFCAREVLSYDINSVWAWDIPIFNYSMCFGVETELIMVSKRGFTVIRACCAYLLEHPRLSKRCHVFAF
jgi:hypothetical protein